MATSTWRSGSPLRTVCNPGRQECRISRFDKPFVGSEVPDRKSQEQKLTPDEMTGSAFTVTNLGMFGIDFFSGIINPPNAAILSVGASLNKPVLDSNGNLQAGERMTLGLSCDHRQGRWSGRRRLLKRLGEIPERPASLLV